MELQEPERQLFLAISQATHLEHFQKQIFQLVVQRNRINLLVYKPEQEVIVRWIPY
ncbi:element excision factor XisH family protein [Okeania sp. SIO3I5]|uniref:element excision factor XisH family protein n=1 Tax=Okeania sp. SIO3I5 TaxID=2607805 RepID=UPI0025F31513|nr:element excision factor XisH family protein [Okeania sp. SIO3I5]